MTTLEILQGAKKATRALSLLSTDEKNTALLAMANALVADTDAILEANNADIDGVKNTMNDVMIDRLRLGYVVDMIATDFMNFPVFNVADIFITCGCILLMLHLVFLNKEFWKDEKQ